MYFRRHDVGGRDLDVLLPDPQAGRQEEVPLRRPQLRPPGEQTQQKINPENPTNKSPSLKTLKLLAGATKTRKVTKVPYF